MCLILWLLDRVYITVQRDTPQIIKDLKWYVHTQPGSVQIGSRNCAWPCLHTDAWEMLGPTTGHTTLWILQVVTVHAAAPMFLTVPALGACTDVFAAAQSPLPRLPKDENLVLKQVVFHLITQLTLCCFTEHLLG